VNSEVKQLIVELKDARRLDVATARVLRAFAKRIKSVRRRMLAGDGDVPALTHELAALQEARRLVEGT
jgi:hypothetical protein